jgi:hypothetical protein
MENESILPDPPMFSAEDMERCKSSGNYAPVFFEWYKFVASLAFIVSHIEPNSPALRQIPAQHFHVLVGLLNRCARLMLANVALSHEGKFGETTAIVDRCIFESAIKIMWLSLGQTQERFDRYLAEGLKADIELKKQIEANIAARNGIARPFETRMLTSIANVLIAAEMTESEVLAASKMPDVSSIMSSIGYDRLHYVVAQKIGSHHIHGTWPSLAFHYLQKRTEDRGNVKLQPRGHDCDTHINQYMYVSIIVLQAMAGYVGFAMKELTDSTTLIQLFESTERGISTIYNSAIEELDLRAS